MFLIWTVSLAVLYILGNRYIIKATRTSALAEAQANLDKDVAFRNWAAMHGGLYVPVTEKTPPSPYLAHIVTRDIQSTDGSDLTLMNPAYVVRQLNEAFPKDSGIIGHLTSLKLLRPENGPDKWETAVLQRFDKGEKEIYEFTEIDGEPYLRLMRALTVDKGCLKCHSHQGYKIGDIRGGAAVALSLERLHARKLQTQRMLLLLFSCLWVLVSSLILWGSRKLNHAYVLRDETLHRMETLYQKSTDGILLLQDGKFIDCNESALRMLGYANKEMLVNHHPADTSPERQPDGSSSRKKAEEMMQRCLEQGSSRFEWMHQNAQGKFLWIEVVLTRIELQNAPVIHVAWRDIDAFKKDQQELTEHRNNLEDMLLGRTTDLQKSHDAFQRLVDELGDKFIVFSYIVATEEVTYASDGVMPILGLTKEEVIGKPWKTLIDCFPEDLEVIKFETQELLEGRSDFAELELRFMHPDKGARTLRSSAHVIQEGTDSPVLIGGILEDISEQKELNRQLREEQQKAEGANKLKSQFLANMSHEIRTPMNALIGLSELALDTPLNAKQQDYLSKIHSSSLSLLTLLNDILDFSKIEAGKLTLEKRAFSLVEMIDDLGTLFAHQAQQKGLELQLHRDSSVPATLYGDPFRLRQVLVNLINNGLKFTEQGSIHLSVSLIRQTEKEVRLKFTVTDSGIGISAAQLTLLFKAFSQVDASYTRKYGGTGLGLAISKQLTEMMGGRLSVESDEGIGSTFTITLDFEKVSQQETTLLPSRNPEDEKKLLAMQMITGAHVLLVEDDVINQQVAAAILGKAGLYVEFANNGKEAIEEYKSALRENMPFAAILMDIHMPIMDGYKAVAAIRDYEKTQLHFSSHTPIIAMTAQSMEGDQEKCLVAGMDDYIAKPVNSSDLYVTLAKWIGASTLEENERAKLTAAQATEPESRQFPGLPDTLPGLDLRKGLAQLEGDTALYLRLLKQFAVEKKEIILEIKETLQKNEPERARQLLHTIKGLAATLGATGFSRDALKLDEDLARKRDTTVFLEQFMISFDELFASIASLQPEEDEQEKHVSPDTQELLLLLEELIFMLGANDFNATLKWLEIKPLFQIEQASMVEKIDASINSFEFDRAMELLTDITARIRRTLQEKVYR